MKNKYNATVVTGEYRTQTTELFRDPTSAETLSHI